MRILRRLWCSLTGHRGISVIVQYRDGFLYQCKACGIIDVEDIR